MKKMKVNVTLVVVIFALGFVDAARRRVRSTTATVVTTTPASFVGRQLAFAGQPEEIETLWDNFEIQKLDSRSEIWKNVSKNRDETSGRQYPGLPVNPGDTNELPSPISPQPISPPQKPLSGCLGPRGQYASSKNCANYLNCWDDVVIEQTCPHGLHFNDIAGYCDFVHNVNCGDRPHATPKPALASGSKRCPDLMGRYRSSTNCSEFYVCVAGRPTKFCCPHSLVYNDIMDVCDYPHNVDCKDAATPKPLKPTQPPNQFLQSSTQPSQSPTQPSQPLPINSSQPPIYTSQSPTYTYTSQPPIYQSQPSTNPSQPPIYQPYPSPPSSYSGNPWLNKIESDTWLQRLRQTSQLDINHKEKDKQEETTSTDSQQLSNQSASITTETSDLVNPWTLFQAIPSELANTTCNNGDVHKLNDTCINVVVCRNNKPQMVRCSTGFSYDKSSDSCMPLNVAKC